MAIDKTKIGIFTLLQKQALQIEQQQFHPKTGPNTTLKYTQ